MIATLLDALHQAGIVFTSRELQDIVLLASRMDSRRAHNGEAGDDTRAVLESPAPASAPAPRQDTSDRAEVPAMAASATPAASALEGAQAALHAAVTTGTVRGNTLRVAGVAPLPAPTGYRRALYPFMRRLVTPDAGSLDEEATATQAVETGIWMPVRRSARERWFDVILLVEDSPSVDLWHEAIAQLAQNLHNHSGMRSVAAYRLVMGSTQHLVSIGSGTRHPLAVLRQGGARQLIVFATDGTSVLWRDGRLHSLLTRLAATTPVSVLQLLPRHAWRYTALGAPGIELQAGWPGQPNAAMAADVPWWLDDVGAVNALRLPALSLDLTDTAQWARAMHAQGDARVPGWLLPAPLPVPNPEIIAATATAEAPGAIDPALHIASFQHMVSAQAYDLAVFLSAIDPLTVPVMRLVQRAMLPSTGTDVLAEFFVGGLLELSGPADAPRDERQYRFRPGLRQELAGALRLSEGQRIEDQLRTVGNLIAAQGGGAATVKASFPAPNGHPMLCEWSLPFAQVSLHALNRIEQAGAAVQLTASMTAEAYVEPALVPVTAPLVTGNLRILHLSDLHAGEHQRQAWHERKEFGVAWDENLRTLNAHGGVDMVCISGDLTWNGEPEHFEQLSVFLDRTLSVLGLTNSSVYAIPGNHDMAVQQFTPLYTADSKDIFAKTSNYRRWASSYLGRNYDEANAPYADCTVFANHGFVPVRVLEWGSSWTMLNPASQGAAIEQLQGLLDERRRDSSACISILLSHIPLSAMPRAESVERLLQKSGVHLVLHSHYRTDDESGWSMAAGSSMLVSRVTGTASRSNDRGNMLLLDFMVTPSQALPSRCWQRYWSFKKGRWESLGAAYWDEQGHPYSLSGPRPSPARQVPFIGRHAEMDALDSAVQAGVPFWISGREGIGKTAIAYEYFSHRPDLPVEWLDAGTEGDLRFEMMRATGKYYAPDVFYQRLRMELKKRRSLLVIDNINTAEQAAALQAFLHELEGWPVLILSRLPVPPWLRQHLTLGPLSESESAELIGAASPHRYIPASTRRELIDASGGVPKKLIETVHTPVTSAAELNSYQHELIEAALSATRKARNRGNRKAGVLVQPAGSGSMSILTGYLQRCHQALRLSHSVIVIDQADLADMLLQRFSRGELLTALAPHSAKELEHLLNAETDSTVLITTVEQMELLKVCEATCIVVFYKMRAPSSHLMEKFPSSTSIVFADHPSETLKKFGSQINMPKKPGPNRSMLFELPTMPVPFLRRGNLNYHLISEVAGFISRNLSKRPNSVPSLLLIIVPNIPCAIALSAELEAQLTVEGYIVNATTKMGQREWLNYRSGDYDKPSLYVVTSNQVTHERFEVPAVCYVCCPLSQPAQSNLLASVTNARESSSSPVVVDLAGNGLQEKMTRMLNRWEGL
ncbi:SAV_2336 N-terminal domain-related protein [Janthinobacterium sp. Mn2066]|uniref:SAV_2336 N-terminal domain-related protein n=1 Tax=Janthinobacterium sp. Mn2066 TaxID=3395264 RepID=UPI003BE38477